MKKYIIGRSMMEMIGILAIIGVLSVGSVTAIRYAFDKIKANQILNDVSLGFAEIKTREQSAKNIFLPLSFKTESGHTLSGLRSDTEYNYVKVDNVKKSVCKKLLTFKNTPPFGEIYQDISVALSECTDTTTMIFSEKGAKSPEGEKCFSKTLIDKVCCQSGVICQGSCCDAGQICSNENFCETLTDETLPKTCNSNIECGGLGGKYFCAFESHSSCTETGAGSCRKISDFEPIISSDKKWIISNLNMSWFSAVPWCQAQKKEMINSWQDVDCHPNEELFTSSRWYDGNGCSTSSIVKCEDYCVLAEGAIPNEERLFVKEPNSAFTTHYVWTKQVDEDTCWAYRVLLAYGEVYTGKRSYYNTSALCH